MSSDMDGWTIITLNDEYFTYFPTQAAGGWLEYRTYPAREQNYIDYDDPSARDMVIYYWQAPMKYYGNRVSHVCDVLYGISSPKPIFVLKCLIFTERIIF